jgi:hypothetical protein
MEKEFRVLISGRIGTSAEHKDPIIEVYPSYEEALDAMMDYAFEGSVWKAEPYDPMPETWEEIENAPLSAWEQAIKLDVDGLYALLIS